MTLPTGYIKYANKHSIKGVIPSRMELCESKLTELVNNDIIQRNDILFHPNDVKEYTDYRTNDYILVMHGILIDGSKVTLQLTNFMLYFDIRKPSDISDKEFMNVISDIQRRYDVVDKKIRNGRGFKGYEKDEVPYATLYFKSKHARESAMDDAIKKFKTTSNERSQFHRVACKDNNYSLCKWNVLHNYNYVKTTTYRHDRIFTVDATNINIYEGDVMETPYLMLDKMITRSWDIETHSPCRPGQAPQPRYVEDTMVGIGQTFHWKGTHKPFIKVMTIIGECDPVDDVVIIECKNERDLILATHEVAGLISQDLSIGFNTGGYDWPWVIERAYKYNILTDIANMMDLRVNYNSKSKKIQNDNTYKYKCRRHTIKLEAQLDVDVRSIEIDGCIDIDISPILRKLHLKEITNTLKHFLSMYKLAGKDDLPITKLFEIFTENIAIRTEEKVSDERRNQNKSDMSLIVKYCIQDCIATHNLLIKINAVNDMREISHLSRTSFYDAVYYAHGMKVINLAKYYGKFRNFYFSSIRNEEPEKGKFPGAYVVSPKPKLYKPILTFRERKIKHPKWSTIPESDIKLMEQYIYEETIDIKFDYKLSYELFTEFLNEEKDRAVVALDLESLYPSIIMVYNICPSCTILNRDDVKTAIADGHELYHIHFEYNGRPIEAWVIRHDTIDGVTLKPGKTKNKFGLLPYILKMLKDDRRALKRSMKPLELIKKEMENKGDVNSDEYHEASIRFNYINAKQKALKVYMNTIYGIMGDPMQTLYLLENAGGITSIGRNTIKALGNIVTSRGWVLRYGDTDSMYCTPPDDLFKEVDRQYYGGQMSKVDYCTKVVEISIQAGKDEETFLNIWLEQDTGTNMMRIAQEGTGYPYHLIAPKMYYYLTHEHYVSFNVSKHNVVIHGLIAIKRGTAMILVNVSNSIVYKLLDINVLETPLELVNDSIKYIYSHKWNINDFKKNMIYKPDKKNATAHTFYNRMVEREDDTCLPPKPGVRFEYVVIRKYPYIYDEQGRKSHLKIGDKIEYTDYAIKHDLPIDLDYYMSGGIHGCIAQLASCDPMFDSEGERKTASKRAIILAKKYIEKLSLQYNVPFECRGKQLKKEYKERFIDYKRSASDYTTYSDIICTIPTTGIFEYLVEKIKKKYHNSQIKYATEYLNGRNTNGLLKTYNLILSMFKQSYSNAIREVHNSFNNIIQQVSQMLMIKNKIMSNICLFDPTGITELHVICTRLSCIMLYGDKLRSIVICLRHKNKYGSRPPGITIKEERDRLRKFIKENPM